MVLKALTRWLQIDSSVFCLILSYDSHKLCKSVRISVSIQSTYLLSFTELASLIYLFTADLWPTLVLVTPGAWSGVLHSLVSELTHQYSSLPLPTHLQTYIFWRRELRLRQGEDFDQDHMAVTSKVDTWVHVLSPRIMLPAMEFYWKQMTVFLRAPQMDPKSMILSIWATMMLAQKRHVVPVILLSSWNISSLHSIQLLIEKRRKWLLMIC